MHVAIVGCGQLSRMLALAGIPLGFRFSFIADDPGQDTRCVEQLGTVVSWNQGQTAAELIDLLGRPDIVTTEKEQIDPDLLSAIEPHCTVHPNPASFATLQDRSKEKQLLDDLGVPSAPHVYGQTAAQAAATLSLPIVAKSCRGGYDGKNQRILKTPEDVADYDAMGIQADYILEQWIPFEREVSLISVRDRAGNIRHYPITENVHESGILRHSIAPARHLPDSTAQAAQDYIARVMEATGYVGVMAMECFMVNGELLVNEIAPRVHNSGHWTQTGCKTSQFENHLRAIAGLPLGDTDNHSVSGMVNLIGTGVPTGAAFSPNSTMHWYNKTARPGRKLGHVNFCGANHDDLIRKMDEFRREAINDAMES